MRVTVCACLCVRARVCMCVCARTPACACARVRVCGCLRVCVYLHSVHARSIAVFISCSGTWPRAVQASGWADTSLWGRHSSPGMSARKRWWTRTWTGVIPPRPGVISTSMLQTQHQHHQLGDSKCHLRSQWTIPMSSWPLRQYW